MKIKAVVLSFVALALMVGCTKEKRCMCTSTHTVTYIHVENGFRCNKITQIGYERLLEGQLLREWDEVVCEEARD